MMVRGVFLDTSKAFDKVRHQGLQRQNGISGELLNILTDFLDNRAQRIILNVQEHFFPFNNNRVE